jgi:hypothetical protein
MSEHRTIWHDDKESIVNLFVGKSVVKTVLNKDGWGGTATLSDGTVLKIEGNSGCGGCMEGNYFITELNECENIITNVELVGHDGYSERYEIFVYADNRKINLLTVEGSDNGYYGYGYWINVRKAE